MKALAYICSYSDSEQDFLSEINSQKEKIEKFAKLEGIEIEDFYYEKQFARNDYKPVLLEIINNFYGKTDKLIVASTSAISNNNNFRDWVQDELARIGIELVTVSQGTSASFRKALTLKNKVKSIPSLPSIVVKIIQVVQDNNASSEELNKYVSLDVGFTAKILKIANSSFYGSSKHVCSTREAIDILGITTIRGLVLSSEIFKVFATQSSEKNVFNYEKFWQHTILTAIGADFLYELLNNKKNDCLYSAAILHNMGKIMLARYDVNNYKKACDNIVDYLDFKTNYELEKKYCGVSHTEIAHLVASDWNLPDEILDIILYHHNPEGSEKYKLSCTMIYIADVLANLIMNSKALSMEYFDFVLLKNYNINEESICLMYNKLVSDFETRISSGSII
jgi:HD-like signal output (HDOD) protein